MADVQMEEVGEKALELSPAMSKSEARRRERRRKILENSESRMNKLRNLQRR